MVYLYGCNEANISLLLNCFLALPVPNALGNSLLVFDNFIEDSTDTGIRFSFFLHKNETNVVITKYKSKFPVRKRTKNIPLAVLWS